MPPLPRTLTEYEIDAIAHDVRTRPLAEVGQHVMPLIHHALALDLRSCQGCRFWVAYNRPLAIANQGECTNPTVQSQLSALTEVGEAADVSACLVTAFDWCCKGWEGKPADADIAEKSIRLC